MRSRLLSLLTTCALVACGAVSSQSLRTVGLGEDITLAPGEAIQVTGEKLAVEFIAVTEDSRCPLDATCVWAGEVKVALELRTGAEEARLEIVAGQAVEHGPWRVHVLQVQPERTSSTPIAAEAYRATLRVER